MTPREAALRLAWSLTLGGGLGIFYGFLRPLGRHTLLRDSLFLMGLVWVFLYLGFGVCGGDLRFGCFLALMAGTLAGAQTVGRWIFPVFCGIWKGLEKIGHIFILPGKKLGQSFFLWDVKRMEADK